jgi:hypothetical protein
MRWQPQGKKGNKKDSDLAEGVREIVSYQET